MLETTPSVSKSGTVQRPREHLTESEIERLMTVARQKTRWGHMDATAILVAFRHSLRAGELCDLQWDQIDFARKTIRIRRAKNGDPSTHYLGNSELRALRRLQRENPPGPHVFCSERGGPVTTSWFRKLRHSCGYKFANEGRDTRSLQAYLGHRNIQSTVRYTAMAPDRFKGWEAD
jgi:integrase